MPKTKRLVIELLAEKDAGFILELLQTEGWIRFIGDRHIYSVEEAKAYIQKMNENPAVTYWTVSLKEGQQPIGVVTLIQRDYLDLKDIGFAFLPAFGGHGYAFEAVQAVGDYVTHYYQVEAMYAIVLPENNRSIRLLEKLGFKFLRVVENESEKLHLYGGSLKTM